jgi:hypothetical protein
VPVRYAEHGCQLRDVTVGQQIFFHDERGDARKPRNGIHGGQPRSQLRAAPEASAAAALLKNEQFCSLGGFTRQIGRQ